MKHVTRSIRAGAGLGLALATLLTSHAALAQQGPQAGVAAAVRGQVLLAERAGAVGKIMKSGDQVFLGNAVKSGPDSGLQIILLDRTTFTIGPDSELVIDEFVYDPGRGSGKVTATVAKGVFRFVTGQIARDNPENMLVKMPAGTIGIRGTIAMGQVVPGAAPGAPPSLQEVALLGPGRDRDSRDRKGALQLDAPGGQGVTLDQPGFGSKLGADGKGWGAPERWSAEKIAALQGQLMKGPGAGAGTGEAGQASADAGTSPTDTKGMGQGATALGDLMGFQDQTLASANFDQQRQQTLNARGVSDMNTIVNGASSFDDLRSVGGGQAYYAGTFNFSTNNGSYTIQANIDFGTREFGGGNSKVVVSGVGFAGTSALGVKSYDTSQGQASFAYTNLTGVSGASCGAFCRVNAQITPVNQGGTAGAAAQTAVQVIGNVFFAAGPSAFTLAQGSGQATKNNGLAP